MTAFFAEDGSAGCRRVLLLSDVCHGWSTVVSMKLQRSQHDRARGRFLDLAMAPGREVLGVERAGQPTFHQPEAF